MNTHPSKTFLSWGGLLAVGVLCSGMVCGDPIDEPRELPPGSADFSLSQLPDGQVLVVGGRLNGRAANAAQLYDPETGRWSDTGALAREVGENTALTLSSGKVLVRSAYSGTTLELYDPSAGTWSSIAAPPQGLYGFRATALRDGRFLATGGWIVDRRQASTWLYDPTTHQWSAAADMSTPRSAHSATLLTDGTVLVAGGTGEDRIAPAERYDPVTNVWSATQTMNSYHQVHEASVRSDGQVVVWGGMGESRGHESLNPGHPEVYDPAQNRWTALPENPDTTAMDPSILRFSLSDGRIMSLDVQGHVRFQVLETQQAATGASHPEPGADRQVLVLRDGRVLVMTRFVEQGIVRPRTALYDPATDTWR